MQGFSPENLIQNYVPAFSQQPEGVIRREIRPGKKLEVPFFMREWVLDQANDSHQRLTFDIATEAILILNRQWLLFSEYGFLVSPNLKLIGESFSFPEKQEVEKHIRKAFQRSGDILRREHIAGPVCVFSNVGYANYYHVLTELLPRLEIFAMFAGKAKLLVMEDSPDYVWQMLSAFGIPETSIVRQRADSVYSADALITLPWGMNFIDHRFDYLRRVLDVGISKPDLPQRKLYITRRKASARNVLNEADIEPILNNYGVELIETEGMSFDAQRELFAQASHIIGPHGAGLANMLLMPHIQVMEIRPANYSNDCMLHLALASGATGYHLFRSAVSRNQEKHLNMYVDAKAFERELAVFLEG